MKVLGKCIVAGMLSIMSSASYAASGSTNAIVPTAIDFVRGGGFIIRGEFGNPSGCDNTDGIWVAKSNPEYDNMLSTAMAAAMANKKIQAYTSHCSVTGHYGGSVSTVDQSFKIVF